MSRALIFLLSLLTSSSAFAAPYDVYGAGARGAAMGSAQTATATGAEALYYNASLLATAKKGLTFGTMATFGRAKILLKERPDGYQVPDIGPPSQSLGDDLILQQRADSEMKTPLAGVSIGVVAPLVFEGLQGGVLIFLPMPTPVTLNTRFSDERERLFSNRLEFERVGSAAHQLDLEFGIAYEVTSWLAVGVGAAYLPGFGVQTGIYLPDPTDQSRADINAHIDTENGFGLLAGLTATLPGDFAVGLAFRDSVALRVTTNNNVQINGVTDGEPIEQIASWTPIYTPASASLGVAWTPRDWTVSADLRYTAWSTYEDAQGGDTDFANIFSGSIGGELQWSDTTALRAGLGYEPSPIPDQIGRSNYVDNDRLNVSLGAGHTFKVSETTFDIAWSIRLQALLNRETFKEQLESYPDCAQGVTQLCDEVPDDLVDPATSQPFPEAQGLQTGNPGFPGWVSGGWVGSIGAEFRY